MCFFESDGNNVVLMIDILLDNLLNIVCVDGVVVNVGGERVEVLV